MGEESRPVALWHVARFRVSSSEELAPGRFRVIAASGDSLPAYPGGPQVSIPTNAWVLDRMAANPILTWGHPSPFEQTQLPIGRVEGLAVRSEFREDVLSAEISFATEDENPWGAQVGRAWAGGLIRAVSAGADFLEAPNRENGAFVAKPRSVEMNHLAVTPIPMDPKALAVARSYQFTDAAAARLFDSTPTELANLPPEDPTPRLSRAAEVLGSIQARREHR